MSLRRAAARAATVGALLVACFGAAACGERRPGPLRVHAHLIDSVHGSNGSTPESTVSYPRASLGGDTRPVLTDRARDDALTQTHATVAVELPSNARLTLGYALEAANAPSTSVAFKVTARAGDKTSTLFEQTIASGSPEAGSWHDVAVDLGVSGGVTLEFSTSATAGENGAAAYFGDPVITVPADEAARPTSVILISVEALRADHLGIYGYTRATSPNLDRTFQADGLVVERFYTNAVDTVAGHASMLTGYLPTTVLVPEGSGERLAPRALTLAERLRASGYRTAAFTDSLRADTGFARGFELYQSGDGAKNDARPSVEETLERATAWITKHANEPFFAFVQTSEPAAPYEPPAKYAAEFPVPGGAAQNAADLAAYDREIRYVDERLGVAFELLAKLGVLERSVLVVTGPHGEEFGEHGRRYHGASLHEEVLRVPLLLRAPPLLPGGQRRTGPMALVDLVPTLSSLLGLPKPKNIDGEDISAHLRENAPTEPIAIYHEARVQTAYTYEGRDETWVGPAVGVTTWPRRLVRIPTSAGARYELYDLSDDPGESRDLHADRKALGFLHARLDRYTEFRSERRNELTAEPPTAESAPAASGRQR